MQIGCKRLQSYRAGLCGRTSQHAKGFRAWQQQDRQAVEAAVAAVDWKRTKRCMSSVWRKPRLSSATHHMYPPDASWASRAADRRWPCLVPVGRTCRRTG